MIDSILADRFVRRSDGAWFDLATGVSVDVRAEPLPPDWIVRDERCHREWHDGTTGLVDWGRANVSEWFEARGPYPVAGCDIERPQVDALRALDRTELPGVRRCPCPSAGRSFHDALVYARQIRQAGFVPLRAGVVPFTSWTSTLQHRHLAILLLEDTELSRALQWVHALPLMSPRAHLVFDLRPGVPGTSAPVPLARDRDPPGSLAWPRSVQRHCSRAHAAMARGRRADADRRARAAAASARRHGHRSGQVYALALAIQIRLAREDYRGAAAIARRAAEDARGERTWARWAVQLAEAFLWSGELIHAEALITTVQAEADLGGAPLSDAASALMGWLRFWQGRFAECAAAAESRGGPDFAVLRGLKAWAVHDPAGLRREATALVGVAQPTEVALLWSRVFTAVALAARAGDSSGFGDAAASILRAARGVDDGRAARLATALAADLFIAAGEPERAVDVLAGRTPESDTGLLPMLFRWLRACDAAGPDVGARAQIAAAGARGIFRWGAGRPTMQLAEAVPAIVHLVQDAEDEAHALRRACEWLRRVTDAAAVAVLAAADLAVITADGWHSRDAVAHGLVPARIAEGVAAGANEQGVMTVAVRRTGTTLGWLIVKGAGDRLVGMQDLARTVAAILAAPLQARLDALAVSQRGHALMPEILGCSPAIGSLRESVVRAAAAPFPVLVEGESGTGKELVARAVHRLSARRDRRFSAVNCAALTDELLEAELFGHTRGAFTGAIAPRIGLFEEANGGSLFLDEVSELSLRAQAKLLRVLQEREVRRVGENAARAVDVRIIAATNVALHEAAARGSFRQDLLFRLAVVRISLTPLRTRPEDIPVLARAIWQTLVTESGRHVVLGADAIAALARHTWPGNVREFQNAMAALLVIGPSRGRVTARHVEQVVALGAEPVEMAPLHRQRLQFERRAIRMALARHGGRRTRAAQELGLTRQGLVKAIRRLGLTNDDVEGVA